VAFRVDEDICVGDPLDPGKADEALACVSCRLLAVLGGEVDEVAYGWL
jgi:hypothetical protein